MNYLTESFSPHPSPITTQTQIYSNALTSQKTNDISTLLTFSHHLLTSTTSPLPSTFKNLNERLKTFQTAYDLLLEAAEIVGVLSNPARWGVKTKLVVGDAYRMLIVVSWVVVSLSLKIDKMRGKRRLERYVQKSVVDCVNNSMDIARFTLSYLSTIFTLPPSKSKFLQSSITQVHTDTDLKVNVKKCTQLFLNFYYVPRITAGMSFTLDFGNGKGLEEDERKLLNMAFTDIPDDTNDDDYEGEDHGFDYDDDIDDEVKGEEEANETKSLSKSHLLLLDLATNTYAKYYAVITDTNKLNLYEAQESIQPSISIKLQPSSTVSIYQNPLRKTFHFKITGESNGEFIFSIDEASGHGLQQGISWLTATNAAVKALSLQFNALVKMREVYACEDAVENGEGERELVTKNESKEDDNWYVDVKEEEISRLMEKIAELEVEDEYEYGDNYDKAVRVKEDEIMKLTERILEIEEKELHEQDEGQDDDDDDSLVSPQLLFLANRNPSILSPPTRSTNEDEEMMNAETLLDLATSVSVSTFDVLSSKSSSSSSSPSSLPANATLGSVDDFFSLTSISKSPTLIRTRTPPTATVDDYFSYGSYTSSASVEDSYVAVDRPVNNDIALEVAREGLQLKIEREELLRVEAVIREEEREALLLVQAEDEEKKRMIAESEAAALELERKAEFIREEEEEGLRIKRVREETLRIQGYKDEKARLLAETEALEVKRKADVVKEEEKEALRFQSGRQEIIRNRMIENERNRIISEEEALEVEREAVRLREREAKLRIQAIEDEKIRIRDIEDKRKRMAAEAEREALRLRKEEEEEEAARFKVVQEEKLKTQMIEDERNRIVEVERKAELIRADESFLAEALKIQAIEDERAIADTVREHEKEASRVKIENEVKLKIQEAKVAEDDEKERALAEAAAAATEALRKSDLVREEKETLRLKIEREVKLRIQEANEESDRALAEEAEADESDRLQALESKAEATITSDFKLSPNSNASGERLRLEAEISHVESARIVGLTRDDVRASVEKKRNPNLDPDPGRKGTACAIEFEEQAQVTKNAELTSLPTSKQGSNKSNGDASKQPSAADLFSFFDTLDNNQDNKLTIPSTNPNANPFSPTSSMNTNSASLSPNPFSPNPFSPVPIPNVNKNANSIDFKDGGNNLNVEFNQDQDDESLNQLPSITPSKELDYNYLTRPPAPTASMDLLSNANTFDANPTFQSPSPSSYNFAIDSPSPQSANQTQSNPTTEPPTDFNFDPFQGKTTGKSDNFDFNGDVRKPSIDNDDFMSNLSEANFSTKGSVRKPSIDHGNEDNGTKSGVRRPSFEGDFDNANSSSQQMNALGNELSTPPKTKAVAKLINLTPNSKKMKEKGKGKGKSQSQVLRPSIDENNNEVNDTSFSSPSKFNNSNESKRNKLPLPLSKVTSQITTAINTVANVKDGAKRFISKRSESFNSNSFGSSRDKDADDDEKDLKNSLRMFNSEKRGRKLRD